MKTELTKPAILKALEDHQPTSLSGLNRALGGKGSVGGSTAKRLRDLVPDLEDRLAENKAVVRSKSQPKKKSTKRSDKNSFPVPDCCPYRSSSAYAKAFAILYHHRKKGISRKDLIRLTAEATGKTEKKAGYDVTVVVSPREDGSAHRSALKASDVYFVEVENSWIRLVMR